MIRFSGTVEYKDGRREPWAGGGALQAEWEDYALRHDLPLQPTPETLTKFPAKRWQLFLAYAALEREEGFDGWRQTVADVESDEEAVSLLPSRHLPADDGRAALTTGWRLDDLHALDDATLAT